MVRRCRRSISLSAAERLDEARYLLQFLLEHYLLHWSVCVCAAVLPLRYVYLLPWRSRRSVLRSCVGVTQASTPTPRATLTDVQE